MDFLLFKCCMKSTISTLVLHTDSRQPVSFLVKEIPKVSGPKTPSYEIAHQVLRVPSTQRTFRAAVTAGGLSPSIEWRPVQVEFYTC